MAPKTVHSKQKAKQKAEQKAMQRAGLKAKLAQLQQLQGGRANWPLLVALLLAAVLVLRIGIAARSWVSGDVAGSVPPAEAVSRPEQPLTDLAALQALNLFGAGVSSQRGVPAQSAPIPGQSSLSLQLEGVVLATPPENSVALIVSSGQQQSYRARAELPGGSAVRLESIHADHVVIDNNGRAETLWLYQARTAPTPAAADSPPATPTNLSSGAAVSSDAVASIANLGSSDPAVRHAAAVTLAEVIQVSPAVENGALVGYRLVPGARLKEFVQYGFQTNDVVTAVNGIPLNDMANVPQLYSLMNGASEVSFSLMREGKPLTLQIAPGN